MMTRAQWLVFAGLVIFIVATIAIFVVTCRFICRKRNNQSEQLQQRNATRQRQNAANWSREICNVENEDQIDDNPPAYNDVIKTNPAYEFEVQLDDNNSAFNTLASSSDLNPPPPGYNDEIDFAVGEILPK